MPAIGKSLDQNKLPKWLPLQETRDPAMHRTSIISGTEWVLLTTENRVRDKF